MWGANEVTRGPWDCMGWLGLSPGHRHVGRMPCCPAWPRVPLSGPITGPGHQSSCLGQIRLAGRSHAEQGSGASLLPTPGGEERGGGGRTLAQQVRASVSPFLKKGSWDPNRPSQRTGFHDLKSDMTSVAPAYPLAAVGRIIQPKGYEGPLLLPLSLLFLQLFLTPVTRFHLHNGQRCSSVLTSTLHTRNPNPKAAWDQAESQAPRHRLSDSASPLRGQALPPF